MFAKVVETPIEFMTVGEREEYKYEREFNNYRRKLKEQTEMLSLLGQINFLLEKLDETLDVIDD